jgi:hypothetical protein
MWRREPLEKDLPTMRTALALSPAVVALAMVIGGALPAAARDAQCRIEENRRVVFDGLCDFTPDGREGSFGLSPRGGSQRPLYGPILSVSVWVMEPGVADVRGLTRDGINSRWGTARRSRSDPACWDGADFRICAR